MMSFIKGKTYNRCVRIHELLANVLERKLYDCFISSLNCETRDEFLFTMENMSSIDESETHPVIATFLREYQIFFEKAIEGKLGKMFRYWSIYIYLINQLHRELQTCVKTNDVSGYVSILKIILIVFFALNRLNYARWGTLFLQKL